MTAVQPADRERIVDHLGSMSWIAGMPEAERAAAIERIRKLVCDGVMPPEMPIHFVIGLTSVAYAS